MSTLWQVSQDLPLSSNNVTKRVPDPFTYLENRIMHSITCNWIHWNVDMGWLHDHYCIVIWLTNSLSTEPSLDPYTHWNPKRPHWTDSNSGSYPFNTGYVDSSSKSHTNNVKHPGHGNTWLFHSMKILTGNLSPFICLHSPIIIVELQWETGFRDRDCVFQANIIEGVRAEKRLESLEYLGSMISSMFNAVM